jgi:hypothetical protein
MTAAGHPVTWGHYVACPGVHAVTVGWGRTKKCGGHLYHQGPASQPNPHTRKGGSHGEYLTQALHV